MESESPKCHAIGGECDHKVLPSPGTFSPARHGAESTQIQTSPRFQPLGLGDDHLDACVCVCEPLESAI